MIEQLEALCAEIDQVVVDFLIHAVRNGRDDVAASVLASQGFEPAEVETFIGGVQDLMREDARRVETLSKAINLGGDDLIELARTILRHFGEK